MAKSKFGHMSCMGVKEDGATVCGERVVVWANENETLSYNCGECGQADYCKKGDYKRPGWLKRIVRAPAAPAAAAPAPAPEKKPAEKKPAPAATTERAPVAAAAGAPVVKDW